jgi:hypothetical protein
MLTRILILSVFAGLTAIGIGVSLAMGFIGWGWFLFTFIFMTVPMLLIGNEQRHFTRVHVRIDENGVTVEKNNKIYNYEWSDISGARLIQSNRSQHIGVTYEVQIVRKNSINMNSGRADVIPDMSWSLNELTNAINEGVKRWRNSVPERT